jgi:DNA-directed RNA polymerase specialized sigma24 family protein
LAEVRELADHLRREIASLPRQQFQVVCLSCLDGKSSDQIAGVLDIPEGAVASALHKARKRLMASMARLLRREKV